MVLTSVSPVISLAAGSVDVGVTDRLFLWWLVRLTSVSPNVFLIPDSVDFGVTDRLFLWCLVRLTSVSPTVFCGSSLFLTGFFSGGWVC